MEQDPALASRYRKETPLRPVIPARIEASLAGNNPWLFLSPHLDDAVLSCGGLIEASTARRNITVATVFTESGPPPHTLAARAFLGQCAVTNAQTLYEERRLQDKSALEGLGVRHIHLGLTDALFRRRRSKTQLGPLAKFLPELVHRYPTYRYDIALGRISRGDRGLVFKVREKISELLEQTQAELLFCPIGVGKHVDHLLTRIAGSYFPEKVIYYSDFPYNQSAGPDAAFVDRHGLSVWSWNERIAEKDRLINQYANQAPALFPDGQIPTAAETYFVAE
jgi:LmbE family N-acetylglucosaminyl deacetylase